MKPVDFSGSNFTFSRFASEYDEPTPMRMVEDTAFICFKMTWREKLKVLFTGKIWVEYQRVKRPINGVLPSVNNPIKKQKNGERGF